MKHFLVMLFVFTFFISNAEIIDIPDNDESWYNTGVFYELFVRSFKDTDGDKYGDFNGVIEKLDYIKSLGIKGIWMMPVTDSAEHTNNYDPVDFMAVDPTYGTMDDFKKLIDEAHKRDLKIIFDLVVNHSSDKHPFFIDAASNKNSKYRDWYLWSDKKPEGYGVTKWTQADTGWYFSYFANSKPDFNYRNPAVVEYMKKVMDFWVEVGVDGFRFDAVTHLVENGPKDLQNQPETFDIHKSFKSHIDSKYKDKSIFMIAEASSNAIDYLGDGKNMFDGVFNFKFGATLLRAVNKNKVISNNGVNVIEDIVRRYATDLKGKSSLYGTVLSNHDTYVGLRPFKQFDGDIKKAKLAGALYLTLPGVPFVYYGEEIGSDTYTGSKSDRWLRNCMQWNDKNKYAGFTDGEKVWNIVNENYKEYNVEKLELDEDSILNLYKKIINIRNGNKALSLGDFEILDVAKEKAAAYLRVYKDEVVLVVHNYSSKKHSGITINLTETSIKDIEYNAVKLLGKKEKVNVRKNKLTVNSLAPYETIIYKLEK